MSDCIYYLSQRSQNKLSQVHPDLRKVIELAIQYTPVDFTVLETVRSSQRQQQLIDAGHSRTNNSRHLARTPKYSPDLGSVSHAADLGALVNNQLSWNWPDYFQIADAVRQAAQTLEVPVVWGGCWQLLNDETPAKQAHQSYLGRKKARKQPAFADGPHFELSWEAYPI